MLDGVGAIAAWVPAGAGLGLGLLSIRLLAMVIAQWNVKEDRIDKGTALLISQLQQQTKDLLEWKERVEVELMECQRRHAASEEEVARLRGLMQGYGDARDKAQLIVSEEKRKDREK